MRCTECLQTARLKRSAPASTSKPHKSARDWSCYKCFTVTRLLMQTEAQLLSPWVSEDRSNERVGRGLIKARTPSKEVKKRKREKKLSIHTHLLNNVSLSRKVYKLVRERFARSPSRWSEEVTVASNSSFVRCIGRHGTAYLQNDLINCEFTHHKLRNVTPLLCQYSCASQTSIILNWELLTDI